MVTKWLMIVSEFYLAWSAPSWANPIAPFQFCYRPQSLQYWHNCDYSVDWERVQFALWKGTWEIWWRGHSCVVCSWRVSHYGTKHKWIIVLLEWVKCLYECLYEWVYVSFEWLYDWVYVLFEGYLSDYMCHLSDYKIHLSVIWVWLKVIQVSLDCVYGSHECHLSVIWMSCECHLSVTWLILWFMWVPLECHLSIICLIFDPISFIFSPFPPFFPLSSPL